MRLAAVTTTCASLLVLAIGIGADDMTPPPAGAKAPPVEPQVRVLELVEATPRIRALVERDASTGQVTVRLLDSATQPDMPPTVVSSDEPGAMQWAMAPIEGRPGTWGLTNDVLKADRFEGIVRVSIGGRIYTSRLSPLWQEETTTHWKPRHGGRVAVLTDCGLRAEIVHNPATGMLTIYSFDDAILTEPPVITFPQLPAPKVLTMMKSENQKGVWWTKHEGLRDLETSALIRLIVSSRPCEGPLVYGMKHGGDLVMVEGGPNLEVVRAANGDAYTVYFNDETLDGKSYALESPWALIAGRTYPMMRVEGEPRAWRVVGLDTGAASVREGQFGFTLNGRSRSIPFNLGARANGRPLAPGRVNPSGAPGDAGPGMAQPNGGMGTQAPGAK